MDLKILCIILIFNYVVCFVDVLSIIVNKINEISNKYFFCISASTKANYIFQNIIFIEQILFVVK